METLRQVWSVLTNEQQIAFGAEIGRLRKNEKIGSDLVSWMAKELRSRELTIKRASPKRFGSQFVRAFRLRIPDEFWRDLFLIFYHGPRNDLLLRCYNLLGVEYSDDDLQVSTESMGKALKASSLKACTKGLVGSYEAHELLCFFAFFCDCCSDEWKPGIRQIYSDIASSCGVPIASAAIQDELVESVEEDGELERLQSPSFSRLDRTIIAQIISSLNQTEGSMPMDDLDDLVQEVVELNDSRSRSWFHRGYLDALVDQGITEGGPGINADRKAWYLCGYYLASIRKTSVNEVVDQVLSLSSTELSALLLPASEPGAMLAEVIAVPLLDRGEIEKGIQWLRILLPRINSSTANDLVAWTGRALRRHDAAEVGQVLDQTLTGLQNRFGEGLPTKTIAELERRKAVALRQTGRLTEAEGHVDQLLAGEIDSNGLAHLLGEKVLLGLGLRRIEGLKLGPQETRATFLATLKNANAAILEACQFKKPVPIGLIASSLASVADKNCGAEEAVAASERLVLAIDAMIEDAAFWEETGLLPRARAYCAILELRQDEDSVVAPAVTRLESAIDANADLPQDLIEDALTNALIQDARGSARLANKILAKEGPRMLMRLNLEELAVRSSKIRETALQFAREGLKQMTGQESFNIAVQLLVATAHPDVRSRDQAGEVLDLIEELALKNDVIAERFITLLEEDRQWSYAWDQDERDFRYIALTRDHGQIEKSLTCLRHLFHKKIAHDANLANDLVDQMTELGISEEEAKSLRGRLQVCEPNKPLASSPRQPEVSILFIGGDEKHARYDARIREEIKAEFPKVKLDFRHTGWSSNWSRQLDGFRESVISADSLVLMTYMRTTLGRHLRKIASERGIPWVSCTGQGETSITRAIKEAIRVAGQGEALSEINEA